ncbi:MAG TPA: hypothetical protein VFJ74_04835 [Gemmatimonadaceae bacterium]|nr:hypothetical protein [Gemmatimonadaceae bacterium]
MSQPYDQSSTGPYDRTVRVTFTAPSTWRFDPDDVPMDGAGNVFFVREPDGAAWTFVGADVTDPHGQFSASVPKPGDRCIVRDDWKVKGSYKYVVTVAQGGREYTSPDPVITNNGP